MCFHKKASLICSLFWQALVEVDLDPGQDHVDTDQGQDLKDVVGQGLDTRGQGQDVGQDPAIGPSHTDRGLHLGQKSLKQSK